MAAKSQWARVQRSLPFFVSALRPKGTNRTASVPVTHGPTPSLVGWLVGWMVGWLDGSSHILSLALSLAIITIILLYCSVEAVQERNTHIRASPTPKSYPTLTTFFLVLQVASHLLSPLLLLLLLVLNPQTLARLLVGFGTMYKVAVIGCRSLSVSCQTGSAALQLPQKAPTFRIHPWLPRLPIRSSSCRIPRLDTTLWR